MSDGLKMYVWEHVLKDYTHGMVAVHARSKGDAWDALYEEDSTAWFFIMGRFEPPEDFDATGNRSERLKAYLESEGKHAVDNAPDPVEVTGREAFVVWGGA